MFAASAILDEIETTELALDAPSIHQVNERTDLKEQSDKSTRKENRVEHHGKHNRLRNDSDRQDESDQAKDGQFTRNKGRGKNTGEFERDKKGRQLSEKKGRDKEGRPFSANKGQDRDKDRQKHNKKTYGRKHKGKSKRTVQTDSDDSEKSDRDARLHVSSSQRRNSNEAGSLPTRNDQVFLIIFTFLFFSSRCLFFFLFRNSYSNLRNQVKI